MKWPWVSRDDRLAVVVTEYARQTVELDQRWQARYDALLDKYHALKVSGASVPEPAPTLQHPDYDPVQAAITAKAGPDRKLRAMMRREAMQSRAAGIPDIEIIQAIEQGVTVDMEGSL